MPEIELLTLSIGLGLAASLLYGELFGLAAGGMVEPRFGMIDTGADVAHREEGGEAESQGCQHRDAGQGRRSNRDQVSSPSR